MVDFKSALALKSLLPGSVWKATETFKDGRSKVKFIVVLNVTQQAVLYVLPTSKSSYFEKATRCSFVRMTAGECDVFTLVTYIGCDELRSRSSADFAASIGAGAIAYVGLLPTAIMDRIRKALASSRVLSAAEKEWVLK